MEMEQRDSLGQQLSALLNGRLAARELTLNTVAAHGWQLLRWEPDGALRDEERAWLLENAGSAFAGCGAAGVAFGAEDKDALLILLCHTAFQARAYRCTALWLCGHRMYERCGVELEQEGTLYVSDEFQNLETWREHLTGMEEAVIWWKRSAPMDSAVAHQHRLELQTILKRRQYLSLGGYVTRALRTEPEPGLACFGLVPVMIEAVWSLYPEISMDTLTADLPLQEMTRRPREALLSWLTALSGVLRSAAAPTDNAPIERVIAAIEADCSLPYTQANLSRSLGLTPAYFCRLFREKTGQHFSTFLTATRMAHARELLRLGGLPLQTVSDQCGYPNKSYFCQVFKRFTGMTPGEYEQHMAEQARRTYPDPLVSSGENGESC